MFGGAEMSRGNLKDEDRVRLIATLTTFSDLLRDACIPLGLSPGQVPFIRPANFVVVLNTDAVHLVVDSIPVGGMPDHTYIDRRNEIPVLPLDAILGSAIRELGFREPLGVSLPITAFADDETHRRHVLAPLIPQWGAQLRERALVQNLKLPPGYEHFSRFMPAFLRDHPVMDRNVFLMMRFRNGTQYAEIHRAVCDSMARYGLTVLRADDKDYTGDLWENVCVYMLGSRFGVAVFEEIDLREFNPNVALELGFMIGQNKRCMILKDQRMPKMPADIVGKLYKEFDTYSIAVTISKAVDRWAQDVGIQLHSPFPP
jgi:hypothetical protein